jgi:hypothetical protein
MSTDLERSMIKWWATILAAAAAALLFTWLAHLAGVPVSTLLTIGAGAVALAWLVVLVTVPWNLYFAARRAVAEMAVSRGRGITVPAAYGGEARQIARRMLWFALGAHIATALAAAVIAYVSGATLGYYFAGFYLLSAAVRPAVAYFAHVRERISTMTRESRHPRDDIAALKLKVDVLAGTLNELRAELPRMRDEFGRTQSTVAGDIAHARQLLTSDLARLQDAQAEDRAAARSRHDDLARRIDQMVHRMESTLDGLSDHQELLTGIRALVRMIRTDAA